MMHNNKRLMLGWGNAFNEYIGKNRSSLSVGLSSEASFSTALPSLRVAGAKTITLIYSNDGLGSRCTSPKVRDEMRMRGFTIDAEFVIPTAPHAGYFLKTYDEYSPETLANISATAKLAAAVDSDAWLFCSFYLDATSYALKSLREIDYTPRYVGVSVGSPFFTTKEWQYVTIGSEYDEQMHFPTTSLLGTNIGFLETWRNISGGRPFPSLNNAFLAMFIIFKQSIEDAIGIHTEAVILNDDSALELVGSNSSACVSANIYDVLYDEIIRYKIDTISGRYSWDINAIQQREWIHLQQQELGTYTIIGPPATKQADLIYPMPKWHERVFDPKYGHWTEILVTVLAILFFAINIGWAVFLPVNLESPKVKASSPLFMGLMLVGSCLLYGSVFAMLPNVVTTFTCNLLPW
eukprot:CAMPEP_0168532174 /NCGR_PEP_ID=MMETSP0405-20121227/16027_1 /TAXON_ID=498012 /ORGANISM="Trichosphaerium sp, Strain Am-I-7 wt" /LENGTH=406 /DNA_ID=CAMNT_0008557399 /DNA_START=430 /DNA_END=1647 /DNA_ORIENTATION=-